MPPAFTLMSFAAKTVATVTSNYATQGDFRHYDASDVALWSRGRFRDRPVMRGDAVRHPDTGGWHFDLFMGGATRSGLTASEARQRCFEACHRTQEARDFVFSDPRR